MIAISPNIDLFVFVILEKLLIFLSLLLLSYIIHYHYYHNSNGSMFLHKARGLSFVIDD